MKPQPLERILQAQGFGSRKDCRRAILAGEVEVDGAAATDPDAAFIAEGLAVSVAGERWVCRERIYVALNKPRGVECSRRPTHHAGVLTLLPPHFDRRGVQPAGRLDADTSGLLLLSDDGAWLHVLTAPRRKVSKRYVAETAVPVTEAQVARLLAGVHLQGESGPLAASACRVLAPHRLDITVDQGRYHQLRRMLAAVGNHCSVLERVAIGSLTLPALGLAPGRWRLLDENERKLALVAGSPAQSV